MPYAMVFFFVFNGWRREIVARFINIGGALTMDV